MKDLVIIGAGGHGRETAQLVKDINQKEQCWNLLGYLDDNRNATGQIFNGLPVLGNTKKLQELGQDVYVTCAIGSSKIRKKVIESLNQRFSKVKYATLIHPTAVVGEETTLQEGTTICAHTVVTTNIMLGHHVIVNYGATIGHDTVIEDFVTVLPGTNISGNVHIRAGADIGTGTAIIPGVEIGANTIVGAGAVVVKSLPADCTAVGTPAKPIKYHSES